MSKKLCFQIDEKTENYLTELGYIYPLTKSSLIRLSIKKFYESSIKAINKKT